MRTFTEHYSNFIWQNKRVVLYVLRFVWSILLYIPYFIQSYSVRCDIKRNKSKINVRYEINNVFIHMICAATNCIHNLQTKFYFVKFICLYHCTKRLQNQIRATISKFIIFCNIFTFAFHDCFSNDDTTKY